MPSVPVCPVPAEQQPINEYQELKDSWFFRWATLDRWGYAKPIALLWALSWLLTAPIAAASFSPAKHLALFLVCSAVGALVLPALALVHLYLGWRYVRDRLSQATIFYEESGWYDGQLWTKPDEVLQRDRLIVTYQIQTILQRIQWTFAILSGLLTTGILLWALLL